MFTPTEMFHQNLRMVAFGPEQMDQMVKDGWTKEPQVRPIAEVLPEAVDKRAAGRPKVA